MSIAISTVTLVYSIFVCLWAKQYVLLQKPKLFHCKTKTKLQWLPITFFQYYIHILKSMARDGSLSIARMLLFFFNIYSKVSPINYLYTRCFPCMWKKWKLDENITKWGPRLLVDGKFSHDELYPIQQKIFSKKSFFSFSNI